MDPFELLKQDHQKVSGLFKQIEAASGQSKKTIFTRLKRELDVHAHIEEAIFYPVLEKTKDARDITLEAYEEHKVVKELLAELAAAKTINDEWTAKLTVLKENVEHHVKEEEGELFDKAEDALDDRQLERLGDQMAAEKDKSLGKAPGATKAKSSKRTGILGTLANLVGLGSTSSEKGTKKKTAKARKAPMKKAAKKSPAKRATKSSASKKRGTAKKASVSSRTAARKVARKSTGKRTGRTAKKR
jgi:hypothetical protein